MADDTLPSAEAEAKKAARRAYQAEWRKANPENSREYQRAYYLANKEKIEARNEATKEHRKAVQKARYQRKKVEITARNEAWRKKNQKRVNAALAARRAANPEKFAAECKDYKTRNADKVNERQRDYHKRNAEKNNKKSRAWYEANTERANARQRAYYEENREKLAQDAIRYRNEKPEVNRAVVARRRARKMQAEGSYTRDDVLKMFAEQAGLCVYCRADLTAGYHVDHRAPLSRGGTNWPDNLQLTCPTCNMRKNRHDHETYLQRLAAESVCAPAPGASSLLTCGVVELSGSIGSGSGNGGGSGGGPSGSSG